MIPSKTLTAPATPGKLIVTARSSRPAKRPAKAEKLTDGALAGEKPRGKSPFKAKPAKTKQLLKTEQSPDTPLSASEERFAEEYLIDLNGTHAYMRVFPGIKAKSARTLGARMLAKVGVAKKIAILKHERSGRLQLESDHVLRVMSDIYFCDTRELVQYWLGCCRYCWGQGHRFQRTDGEMDFDRDAHEEKQNANADGKAARAFNEKGGGGFLSGRKPNPDCPSCAGAGQGRAVINDTRTLSAAARALYAGVKEGKDGVEVKIHDKLTAGDKLFRHMGLYEKDNAAKTAEFTSLDALQGLADRMDASRKRQYAMLEERRLLGLTGD
jgi:phage terminase small subunit